MAFPVEIWKGSVATELQALNKLCRTPKNINTISEGIYSFPLFLSPLTIANLLAR